MAGFWLFMLAVDLLIPITMLGFGKAFVDKPPERINCFFGYRTAMSMKNRDTWTFAHRYVGRLWRRIGGILLPVSVLPLLAALGRGTAVIGTVGGAVCCAQVVPLLVSFLPTERALRRTFDPDGLRKEG